MARHKDKEKKRQRRREFDRKRKERMGKIPSYRLQQNDDLNAIGVVAMSLLLGMRSKTLPNLPRLESNAG